MNNLQIDNPQHVIKIDDTPIGIQEGINAGCYTVGVARWSLNMNMFSLDALTKDDINYKLIESRQSLKDAGADFVIDTLDELPSIIKSI